MLKATALHDAIQQKVQELYGDFGVGAIKSGFSGNPTYLTTDIANTFLANTIELCYLNLN